MMAGTMGEQLPIEITTLAPADYAALAADGGRGILAAVVHGDFDPPPAAWPRLHSRLRPLDGAARIELWRCRQPLAYDEEDGFQVAAAEDFIFAGARVPEADGAGLAAVTQELYLRALGLIARRGYPHILRMWNLISAMNRDQDGVERYKAFCVGRHEAFASQRPDLADRYPAASALGPADGGLCLYFLAARQAGTAVENPAQVSAYRYPAQYGPRSPSFSRALVKHWRDGADLFLSGTASVTGHESRHPGDPVAQAEGSVNNLRTLIDEAQRVSGAAFALPGPGARLKVFVRDPDDYPAVRATLERRLGPDADLLYLEADICRAELLVELEGLISSPAPPARETIS